jgi:(p)ppGpp synthase/HD superfamily hydrolase
MLQQMLLLATQAHYGQTLRDGTPYILHPITVMQLLNSTDEELNCIAIGHDLLEDTTADISIFSPRIQSAIAALTHHPDQSYEDYIVQISRNKDAILVKLADLQHNSQITRAGSLDKKRKEKLYKYFEAYQYLKGLLNETI